MKDKILTLIIGLVAILVVFGSYSLINYIANLPEQPDVNPVIDKASIEKIKNKQSDILKPFKTEKSIEVYKDGLVTPSTLIIACGDKKKDQLKCNKEIANITKILSISGSVETAYLYIKAGVVSKGDVINPLSKYDSVWFYVDDGFYGGHLLRSRAVRQSNDGVTELVYDLKSVSVTHLPYNDNSKPDRIVDILDNKLRKENKIFIGAFVSSLQYGKIFNLRIYYKGGSINLLSN